MFRVLLLVLISISLLSAQDNYSGYKDTVAVASFNADSSGVTRAFDLSQYEDILLSVSADDTSSDGYASDSIKFQWGVEFLNVNINSSGKKDTSIICRILCDTFDILTSANLVVQTKTPDTLGYYSRPLKFIDTVGVTGYAVQHCPIIPYWSPLFRFWYAGLTGNITGSYNTLIFAQTRREAIYVKR